MVLYYVNVIDCGEWVWGVVQWKSKDHMEQAMSKLGAFLHQWRGPLQKISPELGVTGPISGTVVTEL